MDLQDLTSRQLPLAIRYSDITPLGVIAKSCKKKFFPMNAGTFSPANSTIRIALSSATAFLDPDRKSVV